jgi:ABC-2 type transport system permease protein
VSGSAALAPGAGTWLLVRLTVGSFPLLSPASRLATCSLPGAAGPMTNLIYLPLAFGSGLFLPLESVPPAVQQLAPALPSYHLGRLAWGAVGADVPSPIGDAAWLLGATAVLLVLAVFGFRREAVRRFS